MLKSDTCPFIYCIPTLCFPADLFSNDTAQLTQLFAVPGAAVHKCNCGTCSLSGPSIAIHSNIVPHLYPAVHYIALLYSLNSVLGYSSMGTSAARRHCHSSLAAATAGACLAVALPWVPLAILGTADLLSVSLNPASEIHLDRNFGISLEQAAGPLFEQSAARTPPNSMMKKATGGIEARVRATCTRHYSTTGDAI